MNKHLAFVLPEAGYFPLRVDDERERRVSVLTNAIYFFLGSAFIIMSGGYYRLVVMHNGRLLVDEMYKTVKGSKIAFYRFCQDRLWKQGVKPCWSDFYNPDTADLNEHGHDHSYGIKKVTVQKKPFRKHGFINH